MKTRDVRCALLVLTFLGTAEATVFLEQWETAEIGSYRAVYEETTFIHADEGDWYVGDTWSNDPWRGPSPHEARIIPYRGGKALLLLSRVTGMGIAENIWVDLNDFGTHNPGFSIPITPDTIISFDETGALVNPDPWRGPPCIFPPCGDHVSLELTDDEGNIVIYVLQRPADAYPDVGNPYYGHRYIEIFLDPTEGRYVRNVFDDFCTMTGFSPASAHITSIAFTVDEHGWAIIDNLFIGDTGSPPPPSPPCPPVIDVVGISSAKWFTDGVPESGEPWSFHIWVKLVCSDGIHHIDVTKPGGVSPFETIHYDGEDVWHWRSEEDYASLTALRVDYPLGTYKLELQDAAHTTAVTLNLDYSGLPAEPTGPVNFTYPSADGQTGVSIRPTLTWTVGGTYGDALWRELEDYSSIDKETVVEFPVPMSTTSWTPGVLHGGHEHNLTVGVSRIKNWVGPGLPVMDVGGIAVAYAFMIQHMNEIGFWTEPLAPIYRFWSPVTKGHFFTISTSERDKLLADPRWTYEQIAFYAYPVGVQPSGTARVFRFWSPVTKAHFFTISTSERDKLLADPKWTYEGIAWYAYRAGLEPAGTAPVFRFWSPVTKKHFYTIKTSERDKLLADLKWTYEGIAWYAYP